MKVLHILYQSLPQVSGSSIRSRDILMSQKEIGVDVVAVTSLFQNGLNPSGEDSIDGVKYIRTTKNKTTSISDQKKSLSSQIARLFSIIPFSFKLYKITSREKPDILHAHAMFFCAIPTIIIGRIKRIPVVYEFRSLWMFQKKENKTRIDNFLENAMLKVEAFALKRVDYVVFLNSGLKDYFTNKGYVFKNSAIINNAVNTTYIKNLNPQIDTEREQLVFGYIGTLTDYEGIEFLVETFQELFDEGITNQLLIYGSGISKDSVLKIINAKPHIKNISYMGYVNPDEISKAYSEIDVIINPRISNDVTNSVTPLKPIEALAYKKLFIGSDVGGITTLVNHEVTGFIFKAGNKESLKQNIRKVLSISGNEKLDFVKNGLTFVSENKSWNKNAIEYKKIYRSLLKQSD